MRSFSITRKIGRNWSPMVWDQLGLLGIIAGAAFIFAMVTVFVVSMFTDIRISAWSIVGSAAPWLMAGLSGWITYIQLPYYVAHGRTRKAGFREWLNTVVVMVPAGALMMAIGFALELGIYNLAGFSTDVDENYGLTGASDMILLTFQFLLTFGVWFALGGFVGAALYRSSDWGWLSIPASLLVASLAGSLNNTGGGLFTFARRLVPGLNQDSIWLEFGLSGIAVGAAVWLVWSIVKEMPLRNP